MPNLPHEDRLAVTRIVMSLLDQWGVSPADQIAVLGLPAGTRVRVLRRYQQDTPLPDEAPVNERVGHVLAIGEALRTTFPRNAHMGPRWMNRPHRRFHFRSPVATMVQDGVEGLVAVRSDLDCSYGWSQTEPTS